ncbi:hypothetical protein QJS04_geneDACA017034 [Acorus gramineus]|uniref:Polymerase nucleotidyl transferase domain-containing protein n=1 Tax=Acorus gramineus TaxID=55184 RepID=A0AAV9AK02_ACOGR|nr:hypothetical protein QJS04_geneDACA017034 [Acorus gramineus]
MSVLRMGHVQFLQNNLVVPEDSPAAAAATLRTPLTSPAPSNPDPLSIGGDVMWLAEQSTSEIIQKIQPTKVSELRRRDVIDYVQRLLRGYLGCEVFPFGSVPLKTYLPDGDIDLTALCAPGFEESLAIDVRSVLEAEERNKDSEFEVKDVQFIHAEVKLVKCLVQNIVVDISFNQIGGLSTLCFLEQVLYRFLDHFSKFDWDNYCVSINGPVNISTLPKLNAEVPENDGSELLLSKDFLNLCVRLFSVPTVEGAKFPPKNLNIVDPLKETNNLGRSVSKGNFYRIRSAFGYGARKLGRILLLPKQDIVDEINKFFLNTLERHGSGHRPDVQECVLSVTNGGADGCSENMTVLRPMSTDSTAQLGEPINHQGRLSEALKNMRISDPENCEDNGHVEGNVISGGRLKGDAKDLATRITKGVHRPPSTHYSPRYLSHSSEDGNIPLNHALFSPRASDEMTVTSSNNALHTYGDAINDSVTFSSSSTFQSEDYYSMDNNFIPSDPSNHFESNSTDYREVGISGTVGRSTESNRLANLASDHENHLNSLLFAQWFQDPHWSQESQTLAQTLVVYHQPPPSQNRNKHLWDANRRPPTPKRSMFHQMGSTGVISGPPLPTASNYFSSIPPVHPGAFNMEDLPKPRGTGTYFPNMSHHQPYREKQFVGRGRNHAQQSNGHWQRRNLLRLQTPLPEASLPERFSQETAPPPPPPHMVQVPIVPNGSGWGKAYPNSSESTNQAGWPAVGSGGRRLSPHANGFAVPSAKLEFGTLGPVTLTLSKEPLRQPDVGGSHSPSSSGPTVHSSPRVQKLVQTTNQERTAQMYQLKDDHDFPPLSI